MKTRGEDGHLQAKECPGGHRKPGKRHAMASPSRPQKEPDPWPPEPWASECVLFKPLGSCASLRPPWETNTASPHHTGLGARLALGHAGLPDHIRALELRPRKSRQPHGVSICDMVSL